MPIYDALYHYADRLTHILVRHEQGAIHAAQGFARVTGDVGVVFATSGPGATNLSDWTRRCIDRFNAAGLYHGTGICPFAGNRCVPGN